LCAEYNGCEAAVKRRSHARQRAAFDLAYRKHLSPPSVTSVEYAALVDAAATDIERELRSTHTVQVHPGRKADRDQELGWLKSTDWAVGDVETRRGLVRAAAVERVELQLQEQEARAKVEQALMEANTGMSTAPFDAYALLGWKLQEPQKSHYVNAKGARFSHQGPEAAEIRELQERHSKHIQSQKIEVRLEKVKFLLAAPQRLAALEMAEQERARAHQAEVERRAAEQARLAAKHAAEQASLHAAHLSSCEALLREMKKRDALSPCQALDEHIGELGGLLKMLRREPQERDAAPTPLPKLQAEQLATLEVLYQKSEATVVAGAVSMPGAAVDLPVAIPVPDM
jgi:hypothetical protein